MRPALILSLAAALLSASMSARAAAPRVFFSPAERPRITAARAAALTRQPALQADVSIVDPGLGGATGGGRTLLREPRLEGVSLARGGNTHAWIGGERYEDGGLFRGARLRVRQNGVSLLGADGVARTFRVGESIPDGSAPPGEASP